MPNHLAHFAIAADDVERARRFYAGVFGWRIEAWGPPDFYLVFTDSDRPSGSIAKRADLQAARREQVTPGRGGVGWECTLAVDDLATIKAAILKHGGKIVHDEYEIVSVGTMIRSRTPKETSHVRCIMCSQESCAKPPYRHRVSMRYWRSHDRPVS